MSSHISTQRSPNSLSGDFVSLGRFITFKTTSNKLNKGHCTLYFIFVNRYIIASAPGFDFLGAIGQMMQVSEPILL